jgi:RNA ligase partner protein
MEKYILDTNIFFNTQNNFGLGKKAKEVILKLTTIIKEKKQQIFMPPSAIDEFLSFFSEEEKKQSFINNFLSLIVIKSPDYNKISFPANIFHQLIKEIRSRSYRGLTIAEEEVKNAALLMMGEKKLEKKDFQIKIGKIIKKLRERYRQATRFGFLDSTTDLDLIVLAKEIDGFLVSTDEGVVYWGRIFGVKEMPLQFFLKKLEAG